MPPYPLHCLNDEEFEDLVTLICRKILGIGTTSFSTGPDGGKDAKFIGTANCFPSESEPAVGNFVIQAKHTTNPTASCSDLAFEANKSSIVNKEIPKVKRQVEEEGLTNYILFTNRKKTGGAESRIPPYIVKNTGVNQAWLMGEKDILDNLLDYPEIAAQVGLDKLRSPIQFVPNDIRDVIVAFHSHKTKIASTFDSQHDFKDYPGMEKKNIVNGLSEKYNNYIKDESLPRFKEIEIFLKNPRNTNFADQYHAVADELKGQIITHRESFISFDEVLEHVYQLLYERSSELQLASNRRLAKIFIHYMYYDCDIGEKSN
jgi:hypothetical protein